MKAKTFILIIMFVATNLYGSNKFVNKSLICSTKSFPIKGGFYFQSNKELIKYNILWNNNLRQEFLKTTKHCYMTVNKQIVISERGVNDNCGDYNTFIDLNTLTYSIPTNQKILSANCQFFDGDINKVLTNSLNTDVN